MVRREPVHVREAGATDAAAVRGVAASVGQDHEWAAGDPEYLTHLLEHGRVVVAEEREGIVGYAAIRDLDGAGGHVSMLADLFVAPHAHGHGCGRALLEALWHAAPVRMTFSSLHPSALPLYTRFGLAAWWPLLHLSGPTDALAVDGPWVVTDSRSDQAAALDEAWSGTSRVDDYRAWWRRPGARLVTVTRAGEPVAVGAAARPDGSAGAVLEHLCIAPDVDDPTARGAVLAVVAGLGPVATVHLPAPHPAVGALLARRWRVATHDLFMATEPGLLDPRRAVPSPALA